MAKNDFQYGGWNSYTLQYGMWLWNRDSEFTKWQHPAMWYVALGWHAMEFAQTSAILEFCIWFPFPHITAVDMSFCTSLRNFIQIGPPSAEKNDVMSIFKMRDVLGGKGKWKIVQAGISGGNTSDGNVQGKCPTLVECPYDWKTVRRCIVRQFRLQRILAQTSNHVLHALN